MDGREAEEMTDIEICKPEKPGRIEVEIEL